MDYKQLAENSYKVFKHFSQWNKQDLKRIDTVAKLLQTEIEKELAKAGLVESSSVSTTDSVQVTTPRIIQVETIAEPLSLLQRIVSEQDNAVEVMEPKTVVTEKVQVAKVKSDTIDKRYFVTIMCTAVKSKPSFQLFKGLDITATDFKTDEILSNHHTFYTVIDSNRADIAAEIDKHFLNAYISEIVEHDSEWIPPQYKAIWQNKTKLN